MSFLVAIILFAAGAGCGFFLCRIILREKLFSLRLREESIHAAEQELNRSLFRASTGGIVETEPVTDESIDILEDPRQTQIASFDSERARYSREIRLLESKLRVLQNRTTLGDTAHAEGVSVARLAWDDARDEARDEVHTDAEIESRTSSHLSRHFSAYRFHRDSLTRLDRTKHSEREKPDGSMRPVFLPVGDLLVESPESAPTAPGPQQGSPSTRGMRLRGP